MEVGSGSRGVPGTGYQRTFARDFAVGPVGPVAALEWYASWLIFLINYLNIFG
jgi:hypothetical protein